jgi:hypothetical protein
MPINAASILSRHNPHLFAFVVRFAAKKTSFLGGTRLSFCKSSGFMCDMFKTWHIVVIHPIKIKKKHIHGLMTIPQLLASQFLQNPTCDLVAECYHIIYIYIYLFFFPSFFHQTDPTNNYSYGPLPVISIYLQPHL